MKESVELANQKRIRWLTFLMFMMFAMTTDAVGVIIPEVIKEFNLSLTQAGAFHYVSMAAIAISGLFLGFLADKLGRKPAILLGLASFSSVCVLFVIVRSYPLFLLLIFLSGCAIGVFKTAALALIGDITQSADQHTKTMNTVEGFFGVGAIIGPAIVTLLLSNAISWKYLYLIAGFVSLLLIFTALFVKYPEKRECQKPHYGLVNSLGLIKSPYTIGFSVAIAMYVATEVAIYVWMPSLLKSYHGKWEWVATYALTVFFVLRAGGRFLGTYILSRFAWDTVMLMFSAGIFLCFLFSMWIGVIAAIFLLPLSGLFMSMIYPTLNSRAISCFPKQDHGAIAGVILFFTAVAAALGPLLMGVVGDWFASVAAGFYLACAFSGLLFLLMFLNWRYKPTKDVFSGK